MLAHRPERSPQPDLSQAEATSEELGRIRDEFATFSSRVSHDLQAVLRNIEAFATILQESLDGQLGARQEHYFDRLRQGVARGDSILRDLGALSSVATAAFQPCWLDAGRVVRHAAHRLAARTEGRRVEWALPQGGGTRIHADAALLDAALGHLLSNALKFTRDRDPARIAVHVEERPASWVLSVSDNGVGFDPAYAHQLFKPFERLHSVSEFSGNGTGLALVSMVARRHGGSARVQLQPAGGVQASIELPRVVAPSLAPTEPAPAGATGLRVLLVDDEAMVLATVKGMLERDGHAVTAAAGGAAGLGALQQEAEAGHGFDVVLSDWLMPHLSGPRLAQEAKRLDPGTHVVLLTGQRPGLDGRHALPEGVDEVLGKPVRAAELRAALGRAGHRALGARASRT